MSQELPSDSTRLGAESGGDRDQFAPHELARALSHFDIGPIEGIRVVERGSRRSPKVHIRTAADEFILKRRAPRREDLQRVRFSHAMQQRLARLGYPVAALIPVRNGDKTVLQLDDNLYELFRFIPGDRFDRSTGQTRRAGAALGTLHRMLIDEPQLDPPPARCYHAAEVAPTFAQIAGAVGDAETPRRGAAAARSGEYLADAYREACDCVESAGFDGWSPGFAHGDWHPGNLRFRDDVVVGVLDFDAAHVEPRTADIANGALQFSMQMGRAEDPASWPAEPDTDRLRAFIQGYDSSAAEPLDDRERGVLPWLIIEALIVESIVPIAASGRFGRIPGDAFLDMVVRKVRWMRPRAGELVELMQRTGV